MVIFSLANKDWLELINKGGLAVYGRGWLASKLKGLAAGWMENKNFKEKKPG